MVSTETSSPAVKSNPNTMHYGKKSLSLSQMLLLNTVVCGVEVCACAGFTFIPPLLLKIGFSEENMSIILGMGPLLCFIMVPMIGRASDRCRSRYGRRRPFIFSISLCIVLSMILIPFGENIGQGVFGENSNGHFLGICFVTAGVILLDFSSQACLTPCEALLSDASCDTEQNERIFTVYSFMISAGGCIGYLLTALDWSSTALGQYFGSPEQVVFSILILLYMFTTMATLLVAEESPLLLSHSNSLSLLSGFSDEVDENIGMVNNIHESGYETSSESSQSDDNGPFVSYMKASLGKHMKGKNHVRKLDEFISFKLTNCNFRIPFLHHRCPFLKRVFKSLCANIYRRMPEPMQKFLDVPLVLRKLALANFCSWTAIMGFNIFYTDFVGQAVYGGNPNAPENSLSRNNFDEGVRMGSWGLLFHCITSAVYSPFIERLVVRFGIRQTYLVGMASFSAAMFIMVLFKNITFVNAMAAVTGFGYATLTTIPFILVSSYHSNKEIYFFDIEPSKITTNPPVRGIAMDMAILDSAYFFSQVILSAIMGYIVHITGTVLAYIVTAGIMGIFSCVFATTIIVSKQDVLKHIQREHQRALP